MGSPTPRRQVSTSASETKTLWLVPAARRAQRDGEETLRAWLAAGRWGIRDGRSLRAGDRLAFYLSGTGVVATARVAHDVTRYIDVSDVPDGVSVDMSLWHVDLDDCEWLQAPVPLSRDVLEELTVFRGQRSIENWGWLVQTKRRIPPADFDRLTTGVGTKADHGRRGPRDRLNPCPHEAVIN